MASRDEGYEIVEFAKSLGWVLEPARKKSSRLFFYHPKTGERIAMPKRSTEPRAAKNNRAILIRKAKGYDDMSVPFPFVRTKDAFFAVPRHAQEHYLDPDNWVLRRLQSKEPVVLVLADGRSVHGRLVLALYNETYKMPVAALESRGELHYFMPQLCEIPYDPIPGDVPTIRVLKDKP